jgi:hypothetical protein
VGEVVGGDCVDAMGENVVSGDELGLDVGDNDMDVDVGVDDIGEDVGADDAGGNVGWADNADTVKLYSPRLSAYPSTRIVYVPGASASTTVEARELLPHVVSSFSISTTLF